VAVQRPLTIAGGWIAREALRRSKSHFDRACPRSGKIGDAGYIQSL